MRRQGIGWGAQTFPSPDSTEVVEVLDFDQDESVMLLASQEMFSQLQRGVSAGATVHKGQVHDDVSPVKGSFILEFDDGLIASVAPCGFVDEVMPLDRHLQSSGRPVTDAGALLQELNAGEQTPLLDELTDAAARPQPISTPAAPDGRFDRDIHPSGQTLPRTRLQLTVPPSWQELGGVICAEAPQGFSACSSVRQIAGGSPVERYIRSEAGADVSLVWSAEQVGPAFVPITLGTHALPDETPCGFQLTAAIQEGIQGEEDLRRRTASGPLVTWEDDVIVQATPTDPSSVGPDLC